MLHHDELEAFIRDDDIVEMMTKVIEDERAANPDIHSEDLAIEAWRAAQSGLKFRWLVEKVAELVTDESGPDEKFVARIMRGLKLE